MPEFGDMLPVFVYMDIARAYFAENYFTVPNKSLVRNKEKPLAGRLVEDQQRKWPTIGVGYRDVSRTGRQRK